MSVLDFVLGTRPEIIKCAPLVRRLQQAGVPFRIVHTGQHYDAQLDAVFFQELQLPHPSINFHAAAPGQLAFMGRLFAALQEYWNENRPHAVVVQGDTNSAFAGAFSAQRLGIPVLHVEAGLRSDDWAMPEECNRVLIDRLARRLYVPTQAAADRLLCEGISSDRILLTGNTVADAVREHIVLAPERISIMPTGAYGLITLHRPALVDDPNRFHMVLSELSALAVASHQSFLFPVHPRTRRNLPSQLANIVYTEPVSYLHMLSLLRSAAIVFTDSGGIQEETALLRVPCVTLRENTERPETVAAGGNRVVGFNPAAMRAAASDLQSRPIQWQPLYKIPYPADTIVRDLLRNV